MVGGKIKGTGVKKTTTQMIPEIFLLSFPIIFTVFSLTSLLPQSCFALTTMLRRIDIL